ncbi:hypothetical protein ZWY2020_039028 [Hordeum vulgare]|nr:hypothetical protein ZWY2020_039028 [Hordeum vulgare]
MVAEPAMLSVHGLGGRGRPRNGRARRRGRKRRRTDGAQAGRADGMAVDALVQHAHGGSGRSGGVSGRSGGACTVAPWPSSAAPRQGRRPTRQGMLAWPGQQGPARPRQGARKGRRQGPAVTPKATLPVAPSLAANSSPADDGATAGSGTGGTPPFAGRGPEGAADSNTPLTEDASPGPATSAPDPTPRRDRCQPRPAPAKHPDGMTLPVPPAALSGPKGARISSALPPAPPQPLPAQLQQAHARTHVGEAGRDLHAPANSALTSPSPPAPAVTPGPAEIGLAAARHSR